MGMERNVYTVLLTTRRTETTLRPRHIWVHNMKIDFKETRGEDVTSIELSLDRAQ
jgi:hypothetical protein